MSEQAAAVFAASLVAPHSRVSSVSVVPRETLPQTTTRSAGEDACFLAKEQAWRTAWRTRSLLPWTKRISRPARGARTAGCSFPTDAGVWPVRSSRSLGTSPLVSADPDRALASSRLQEAMATGEECRSHPPGM